MAVVRAVCMGGATVEATAVVFVEARRAVGKGRRRHRWIMFSRSPLRRTRPARHSSGFGRKRFC
jgi:hypothetical protein